MTRNASLRPATAALWVLQQGAQELLSSLHPTSAFFFFFLIKFWSGLTDLNLTFKWCTDYPLFSFSAVECEQLPWVPSEEWAGVHQACKLQELLTESQLSVGPASVRVPRFTRWDNQNSYSKRTTHIVLLLLFFLPVFWTIWNSKIRIRKFQIQICQFHLISLAMIQDFQVA